jgi:hypothetical protein
MQTPLTTHISAPQSTTALRDKQQHAALPPHRAAWSACSTCRVRCRRPGWSRWRTVGCRHRGIPSDGTRCLQRAHCSRTCIPQGERGSQQSESLEGTCRHPRRLGNEPASNRLNPILYFGTPCALVKLMQWDPSCGIHVLWSHAYMTTCPHALKATELRRGGGGLGRWPPLGSSVSSQQYTTGRAHTQTTRLR